MYTLFVLIKRNIKLFFKDKGMFFSSLITPIILLVLYVTFLANVYKDSFMSALPQGFSVDESIVNGMVSSQLFSSILAVCCITVAFSSNLIIVQDKVNGVRKDLLTSPVKKSVLALSYFISSYAVTIIINLCAFAASLVYVACSGWYLTFTDIMLLLLDIIILSMLGTALSSVINVFLKSQGQIQAVATIVSAGYGFICGAYMPISQFGSEVLQKTMSLLPGTYGTALIKNHAMRGVFAEMSKVGFPDAVLEGIKKSVDCSFEFFGHEVSLTAMFLVVLVTVVVLVGAYVLINIFYRDDVKKRNKSVKISK